MLVLALAWILRKWLIKAIKVNVFIAINEELHFAINKFKEATNDNKLVYLENIV